MPTAHCFAVVPQYFTPFSSRICTHASCRVHDVLFDEPEEQKPATEPATEPTTVTVKEPATEAQGPPSVDTTHTNSVSVSDVKPTTEVSTGIEPISSFLPDSQQDMDLFGEDNIGGGSVVHTGEAPLSDARDEPGPDSVQPAEGTQQVPETQPATDPMEISPAQPTAPIEATQSTNPPATASTNLTIQTQPSEQSPMTQDHEMTDAPQSGKVRSREEDDEDAERFAKRTKTESETDGDAKFAVPESTTSAPASTAGSTIGIAQPVPPSTNLQKAVDYEQWPDTPMTHAQNRFLLERIRNTKKIKVSTAFREPVNPEALNIPTYRDFVKDPMDLSTMEAKLKKGQYPKLRDFMADLDLMVENSVVFNGTVHPVTQAGFDMRAYFLKGMFRLPRGTDDPPSAPKVKKSGGNSSSKPKEKRDHHKAPVTAKSPTTPLATAASPQSAWPLAADGMPIIRRDSTVTTDRPKREIHRPPPKDLPYNNAKPKKKKYQQELRFCESVLTEIMKPKYQKFAFPFLIPVDPVALNIPSYLKIIKKPMDFGTIEKNLKEGVYQKAQDFYNDAQLVFQNCFKFNPEGDEVNRMGKELKRVFDSLWEEKAAWLATHAPASDPQSADEMSDDEDHALTAEQQNTLAAIQQQIAQLNETAKRLQQEMDERAAARKKKAAPKKKALAVPPPAKAIKPAKPRKPVAPLSFAQKQEISEGILTLGDEEMPKAVQIIKNGCPHLRDVNDDEMEIDMDEIDDNTLRELYKFIKQVRGPKAAVADDDFEPPRPSHKPVHQKPKKNKPMGKKEQEENIKRIEDQLRNFNQGGGGGGDVGGYSHSSPGEFSGCSVFDVAADHSSAADDDSSDEDSSGSESEEE